MSRPTSFEGRHSRASGDSAEPAPQPDLQDAPTGRYALQLDQDRHLEAGLNPAAAH